MHSTIKTVSFNTKKDKIEDLQHIRLDWWNIIDENEKADIENGIHLANKRELKTTQEVLSKYSKYL